MCVFQLSLRWFEPFALSSYSVRVLVPMCVWRTVPKPNSAQIRVKLFHAMVFANGALLTT